MVIEMETQVIVAVIAVMYFLKVLHNQKRKRRIKFIKSFEFPDSIKQKIWKAYPHLKKKQIELVLEALKSFFIISYQAKRKPVAMPSQVVDDAWHEFILFTKHYELFCKKGMGRFLHHTPTEAMASQTSAQEGIKRAWRLACNYENINTAVPKKLPMLFAIDSQLKIENGFFL